ncbi:hypothetical protein [Maribacter sp. 2210JD10-5]|uniref:hypothetical protein n=1 Tax=Maribacter sp. 2210JD10-5 TaxID=3386272 RepID=UPI0039BD6B23
MKTDILTKQDIKLIDGKFTPTEAKDLLVALIDHKINFHKLERLAVYAVAPDGDTEEPSGRIGELEYEKNVLNDIIAIARREGKKLKISGDVEITFED